MQPEVAIHPAPFEIIHVAGGRGTVWKVKEFAFDETYWEIFSICFIHVYLALQIILKVIRNYHSIIITHYPAYEIVAPMLQQNSKSEYSSSINNKINSRFKRYVTVRLRLCNYFLFISRAYLHISLYNTRMCTHISFLTETRKTHCILHIVFAHIHTLKLCLWQL